MEKEDGKTKIHSLIPVFSARTPVTGHVGGRPHGSDPLFCSPLYLYLGFFITSESILICRLSSSSNMDAFSAWRTQQRLTSYRETDHAAKQRTSTLQSFGTALFVISQEHPHFNTLPWCIICLRHRVGKRSMRDTCHSSALLQTNFEKKTRKTDQDQLQLEDQPA